MKKILLIIRDYSYHTWQRANDNHHYARQRGRQLATVLMTIIWSIPFWVLIATIVNRMGYGPLVHHSRPRHVIAILVCGALLLGPFAWLAWYQIGTLEETPVRDALSYRKLTFITWSIVFVSFSTAVFVPLLGQALFPL